MDQNDSKDFDIITKDFYFK